MKMSQLRGLWLPFSFVILLLAFPNDAVGQATPCGSEELKASLPSTAGAYPDAMTLSETLRRHGTSVKCVLMSKMDGTFEDQEGAALYRTDRGDFEVLFLPKLKTFDLLEVVERQDGHWYVYSFKGPPQPWPANRIESAQRIYFIKHGNMLFVLYDQQLAAALDKVVRSHRID